MKTPLLFPLLLNLAFTRSEEWLLIRVYFQISLRKMSPKKSKQKSVTMNMLYFSFYKNKTKNHCLEIQVYKK